MPFKRSPRLPSFDYAGFHRYSVTICVLDRCSVFRTHAAVDLVRTPLQITAAQNDFAIVAYCFMPDHLHLLPEGTSDAADFLHFMRMFKQRSSFRWKQRHGRELWQRSYIERVLRDQEDSFRVARYILENPVRAGLVASPDEYPFSGSLVTDFDTALDSLRRT
jgi:putative transposase